MGFLGNKKSGGTTPGSTVLSGPHLPSVGGTTPPSVTVQGSKSQSQTCNHCGKDPNSEPERTSKDAIRDMLNELDDAHGLSVWEDKFCVDMEANLERYGSLTPRQYETLKKIYDERVK